jgi:hypothetical protein
MGICTFLCLTHLTLCAYKWNGLDTVPLEVLIIWGTVLVTRLLGELEIKVLLHPDQMKQLIVCIPASLLQDNMKSRFVMVVHSRIWGSHGIGYEKYCLLGYNAMVDFQ